MNGPEETGPWDDALAQLREWDPAGRRPARG